MGGVGGSWLVALVIAPQSNASTWLSSPAKVGDPATPWTAFGATGAWDYWVPAFAGKTNYDLHAYGRSFTAVE